MDSFDFVNDPITASQVGILAALLGDQWSEQARDGFLIVSGRFVDHTGGDRTDELARLFQTQSAAGRVALRASLERLLDVVGSLEQYEQDYPVLINDPVHGSTPVFPQVPVLGIEELTPHLYRVMDSRAVAYETGEPMRDFVSRTGALPHLPALSGLVLRAKPRIHWCAYARYDSPSATRDALQILPEYHNDCALRATLPTKGLEGSVYVAYNGDTAYPDQRPDEQAGFVGYYVEPETQDHTALPGGGLQVGVVGGPKVVLLEEWVGSQNCWTTVWPKNTTT